ncbi:MAG: hypothetical protein ACQXXL_01780 [Candidatus Methanosuratincola sp.]|jgi:hypothetical protein|nr:hypothetical protein [Candidatus Methanosuratincola sp.]
MTLDLVPGPRKVMRRDASELALLLAIGKSDLPEPVRKNVEKTISEIRENLKSGIELYGGQGTVSQVLKIAEKFPNLTEEEVDEILVLRKSLKYEE